MNGTHHLHQRLNKQTNQGWQNIKTSTDFVFNNNADSFKLEKQRDTSADGTKSGD